MKLSIKKSDLYFRPFYQERKTEKSMRYEPQLPSDIVIVGCGGNGAYLVPLIARFISQSPSEIIKEISITLIDGDVIEEKNILRQNFIPSEKGANKAEALAERCNRAFGMNIIAIPEFLDEKQIKNLSRNNYNNSGRIIIGCVDRHEVRNLISQHIKGGYQDTFYNAPSVYIDVGNELEAGQLFISGPVTDRSLVGKANAHSRFTGQILIHEFYPVIGKTDVKKASPSCDENTATGAQRMVVNVKAATLAFEAFEALLSPAEVPFYEITFGPGATRTYYLSDIKTSKNPQLDAKDPVIFSRS